MAELEQDQIQSVEAQETAEHPSRWKEWLAPSWFLFGVLVGVLGLSVFTAFAAKPGLDSQTMRTAARDGTLDAIATVQAGGPSTGGSQPESSNPNPPTTGRAFAVREANRAGDKNARVTIVEFSDFQ